MPELPEVETIASDLREKIVGKKILGISYCDNEKSLGGCSPEELEGKIKGQKVLDVTRRAKNIFLHLSGDKVLHAHMRMTGHFLVVQSEKCKVESYGETKPQYIEKGRWIGEGLPEELKDPVNQFIHVVFELSGGTILAFSDMRKFGFLHLVDKAFLDGLEATLGPEPLGNPKFSFERFCDILEGSNGQIKKVLLDQSKVAGIGNIYGDEILFLSGVRPDRMVKKTRKQESKKTRKQGRMKSKEQESKRAVLNLSEREIKKIYENIELVLKKAIKQRGASVGDFRDTAGRSGAYQDGSFVYRRQGQECRKCGTLIERTKVAGRSAHFCSSCQK